jgi:hypothetical protein
MSLHYCSLHERRLRQTTSEWIGLPLVKVDHIKSLYQLLASPEADVPEFAVIETCCDQCHTSGREHVPAYIDTVGASDAQWTHVLLRSMDSSSLCMKIAPRSCKAIGVSAEEAAGIIKGTFS